MTNFGVRDRETGALEPLNSSIGAWRKLEALGRDPHVAVAYHSRAHAQSTRPEYVLVQGRARLTPFDRRDYLESIREHWERAAGPRDVGAAWERWLRIYHWRVGIGIDVERIVVWPDLRCEGEPEVLGAPLPAAPPRPQAPPRDGTGPRVRHARAARRASRLPDVLLGWVGADGFPVVAPVRPREATAQGIELVLPRGAGVPAGGRRAGLVAHWFARYTVGQEQWRHTGWMEAAPDRGRALYAPHTEKGYRMPASRTAFRLAAGLETRRRYAEARRAGIYDRT